jgi:DNA uptake protein ComE-like DNA-binding protein
MNFIESHFWYTKRQRNGILFLLGILIGVQVLFYCVDFSEDKVLDDEEFALIQRELDSMKEAADRTRVKQVYAFNPNFLSDFRAYQLGLNPKQIDRLFAFRKQGKFINSAQDFQRVTGIGDSLLGIISPRFKFPDWIQNRPTKTKRPDNTVKINFNADLNKATVEDLLSVPGLSNKMARRIVAYRKLLGGYSLKAQISEVYGLDSTLSSAIADRFNLTEKPLIEKVNINKADFKTVLHVPDRNYRLTKMIFQYKDQNGTFESLEDLKKIDSFPLEKFDRIALYLTAK